MSVSIVSIIVLGLTILAFVVKNGMLYAAGIMLWLVEGFVLYNLGWPAGNTFFPYASIVICIAMAIVMTVQTLNFFLFSRRIKEVSSDEEQASYRRQVYNITHKKSSPWD